MRQAARTGITISTPGVPPPPMSTPPALMAENLPESVSAAMVRGPLPDMETQEIKISNANPTSWRENIRLRIEATVKITMSAEAYRRVCAYTSADPFEEDLHSLWDLILKVKRLQNRCFLTSPQSRALTAEPEDHPCAVASNAAKLEAGGGGASGPATANPFRGLASDPTIRV